MILNEFESSLCCQFALLSFPEAISDHLLSSRTNAAMTTMGFCDRLYPNDHWKVQQYLGSCSDRRQKGGSGSVSSAKENLNSGEGWKRCFERVKKVKANLKEEHGKEVPRPPQFEGPYYSMDSIQSISISYLAAIPPIQVPPIEQLDAKYRNAWTETLTAREKTSLYIHLWL